MAIQRQEYTAAAILLASLPGEELHARRPLATIELDHKPIFVHGVDSLLESGRFREVIVLMHRFWIMQSVEIADQWQLKAVHHILAGEDHEINTLKRGLSVVHKAYDVVGVHDGSRPLPPSDLVGRVMDTAHVQGLAALVRELGPGEQPVDRDRMFTFEGKTYSFQSPVGFRLDVLKKLVETIEPEVDSFDHWVISLIEQGIPVDLIPSGENNPRICTPDDLERCQDHIKYLAKQRKMG